MKRLFIMMCMAVWLCHTSCQNNVMEFLEADHEIQNLVLQARSGEAEAYKQLAVCYCDGNGVEKSFLNAFFMYVNYIKKIGKNMDSVMDVFEEGHPVKLMVDIFNCPSYNATAKDKIAQLKSVAPIEGKVLEAGKKLFTMDETEEALKIIRLAESEGSELAVLVQVAWYRQVGDKTVYEQYIERWAGKYPLFNLGIGDLYIEKYIVDKNVENLQKAITYYNKVDAHGMLMRDGARILLRMYKWGKELGLPECDGREMARLRKIADY